MNRAMTAMCLFLASIVLSVAAQAATLTYQEYAIEFQAKPNKGELRTMTDGQGCNKGPGNPTKKKGCVKFGVDDFGLVTFHLGAQPQTRTCGSPGTHWVISKIELSGEGYELPGGGISNKGIFEDHTPLDAWIKAAFPQVDQNTGVLYEASPGNTGATRVTKLNLNNNDDATPKDIWYRVTVASCEPGSDAVLVTDPRFENDGTSN